MRISDWSSDVCSSDLCRPFTLRLLNAVFAETLLPRLDQRHDLIGGLRLGDGNQRDIINPAHRIVRCPQYPAAHVSQHTGGTIFGFTGHGGCSRRRNDVPPAPKSLTKALAPPLAAHGRASCARTTSARYQASDARTPNQL